MLLPHCTINRDLAAIHNVPNWPSMLFLCNGRSNKHIVLPRIITITWALNSETLDDFLIILTRFLEDQVIGDHFIPCFDLKKDPIIRRTPCCPVDYAERSMALRHIRNGSGPQPTDLIDSLITITCQLIICVFQVTRQTDRSYCITRWKSMWLELTRVYGRTHSWKQFDWNPTRCFEPVVQDEEA